VTFQLCRARDISTLLQHWRLTRNRACVVFGMAAWCWVFSVTRAAYTLRPTRPSGYVLRPRIPVIGGRFPVQSEGIELVGEEDFGKSLITRAKSNIRARHQVDP
jgi:hypothetical protein